MSIQDIYCEIKFKQLKQIRDSDFLESRDKLKFYKKMRVEAKELLRSMEIQRNIYSNL